MQFISQNCHYGIFRVEMAGINEIDTQLLSIPKLIVFHIRGDKGIAAGVINLPDSAAAGAAAYGDLGNRASTIYIAHALAIQCGFNSFQIIDKGLFLDISCP